MKRHRLEREQALPAGLVETWAFFSNYALGCGPLGALAHALLIRRKMEHIFAYRRDILTRHFGAP